MPDNVRHPSGASGYRARHMGRIRPAVQHVRPVPDQRSGQVESWLAQGGRRRAQESPIDFSTVLNTEPGAVRFVA